MLDQLSDPESELQTKPSSRAGEVAGSVRHLTQEDLEAYATGRLAAGRLSQCQTHLDSCDACRAELEDLRAFKSDLSSFMPSASNQRDSGGRKKGRGLTVAQTAAAAVAVVFVAAAAAGSWLWMHRSPKVNAGSAAVSVTRPPVAAVPAPAVQGNVPATTPVVTTAPTVTASRAPAPQQTTTAPQSPPAPQPNTQFALLGPFGEATSDTRPTFSWQPLAGAVRYSVAIVDTGLHPVQRSRSLRTTSWRPRRPLHRGRTYLWQVTATLRNGSKVVASTPSPAETLLRIVSPGDAPGRSQ